MMATIPVAIREVDEDPLADSQDVPMELHSDSSDVSSPDMTPETTKELWAAEGIEVLGPSAAEMAAAASSLAMRSLTDKESSSSVAPTGDVDDEKVLFEGYLRKRYSSSYYMGSWRYCVAHGNRLRWYMNEELARKDQQLRGEIFIKGVEPWNGHGSVNVYPHAFAVRTTSNRVMLCSAKSSSDKERWVQHLTRCVVSERQRRLSRRIVRNHHDGLTLPHGPEAAERRRIVPEDAVRALAVSEVTSSYGNSMNESFNMDGRTTPTATTRQQASASVVSRSSDSDRKSISGNTSVECTRCAVRFGTFVARRVVCGSCHMSFCSRHCNKYVRLSTTQSVHKCCMRCARRQEFLTYLSSVSTFVTSLSKSLAAEGKCMVSLIQRPLASEDPSQLAQEELVYARTVTKLRTAPMSLIKTIKILYQTRQKPHLFCVACERLPFYVENCIDRVESLWYQILHLFQCCDTEFSTFSMQLFCLQRYIAAICRRSPRIALQTIWHVQASMEDSSRHHPNSLLLLLGFLYPPTSSEHNVWTELLLVNTPEHQRVAIVEKLVAIHEVGRSVQTHDPDSMEERWLSATRVSEFQACAGELARSGVQVIDFQSNIQYDSLGVAGTEDEERSHLEDVVADQVRFVQSLAAISERLRHVQPVEDRSKHLGTELEELNANLISSALYPLCVASDELYKVLRVPPTEGKVFSTKMRAPTLIFIEAVPVDAANLVGAERLLPFTSARHRGSLTFIESISAMVDETTQPRDSLESSAESDSTTHGTTPHHRRHGSQLSLPDCLDSSTDDEVSTPSSTGCVQNRQQQTKSLGGMLTNMSFPRDNRSASTHSMPTGGFSIGALANPTTPRITHARMDNIVYDSKVYGESWDERRERIRKESPHGHLPGWQLFSIIVKTNDDLRQEMFTMQMMTKLKSIFEFEQLSLWLRTYRIVATGANIGLLETINDACSLDHLKKTFKGGNNLYEYFRATYGEPNSASFEVARRNFIQSMAAYSIVSYVLLVKDRHNGNILLGAEGHIIHIDFGFILGIAPGGMFSIEDAPFKLTEEMVMIMGGLSSPGYELYRKLMCDGFLALQKYQSEISALLQTTGQHSPFPCFEGAKLARVVSDLRGRLCVGLTKLQIEKRVDHLISKSYNAWGTRKYDSFQLRSNNIHP